MRTLTSPTVVGQEQPNCLPAALDYLALGINVLPLLQGVNRPWFPWTPLQSRRVTEQELRAWFGEMPDARLGIVLGPTSGDLFARDFDCRDAYFSWCDRHGDLARSLPTVRTFRGYHVYGRLTASQAEIYGRTIADRENMTGEFRAGAGSFNVAPPSRHDEESHFYAWLNPLNSQSLRVVDVEAAELVVAKRAQSVPIATQSNGGKYGGGSGSRSSTHLLCVSLNERLDQAIKRTLPKIRKNDGAPGTRNRSLLAYVRQLKAFPEYHDKTALEVRDAVTRWHCAALPLGIHDRSGSATFNEFAHAWAKCTHPAGDCPIDEVYARSMTRPDPKCSEHWADDEPMVRLIALCRELQRDAVDELARNPTRADGDAFFITCREAGIQVGVCFKTAASKLGTLQGCGILKLIEEGRNGRASRYRYLPDLNE